ncbi:MULTISPECIES: MaoC family dehydratase [Vibrio]|uniref:Enoyl-CoA hydratase n=1 Tax=Vibrio fortis TaxID=212667 RepID=A0A066UP78_9VIBR|nr:MULTISPECIES: MaoC family dehydratase [Vibrio]KAB0285400.1 MaoC family dehydratase [Vibrio fortis]KDN28885.1 enoyl-CoA hydratase [Vibrio fortis]MDK9735717.1 MaoC family dehydratase [Vibrio sp. D404a]MDK9762420.1 MaoC family dehydratase [Vibrio sp. D420a]MDK9798633.1 MaoC family dehydratase [Vibrio sp. D449a]
MKPEIGQTATIEKTLDKQTVEAFASVSEDYNPIHLDEDFAKTTQFERPIVHGMLASSLISGLLASKVPGAGSIYLGQSLKFVRPIFVGETVTAKVEVTSVRDDKPIAVISTQVLNANGEVAVDGEATVMYSV